MQGTEIYFKKARKKAKHFGDFFFHGKKDVKDSVPGQK